jgi:hypothetical protein
MNVYELLEKVGGEIALGRARYWTPERQYVVIGRLNGDEMVFTEEGRALARQYETLPALQPARKKRAPSPTPIEVSTSSSTSATDFLAGFAPGD